MTLSIVEELPSGQRLYNIELTDEIKAGQWLSHNNQNFPVFKIENQRVIFLAHPDQINSSLFQINGSPLSKPLNDRLVFIADEGAVTHFFSMLHQLRDEWGLKTLRSRCELILLGTDSHFPFAPVPSAFMVEDLPSEAIATSRYLEDLELPARLAHHRLQPGCYEGCVSDLLEIFIKNKDSIEDYSIIGMGSQKLIQGIKKLLKDTKSEQLLLEIDFS